MWTRLKKRHSMTKRFRIFEKQREESTRIISVKEKEISRKLHNDDLSKTLHLILLERFNSGGIKLAKQAEIRSEHTIFVGKSRLKRSLRNPRRR
jgi:hypothetical protein